MSNDDNFEVIAGIVMSCILIVGFILFIWLLISRAFPYNISCGETNRIELVALANGAGIEGESFLGIGNINTEPYYFYYQKDSDGGLSLQEIDAATAEVYQGSSTDAYIAMPTCSAQYDIFWPISLRRYTGYYDNGSGVEYAIHVPNGTVKPIIDLDISKMQQ